MSKARTTVTSTRRTIASGTVIGSVEKGNVQAWRGVPYARPPLGPLRWRSPQPLQPWEGVRSTIQHGPMAPQYAGLLSGLPQAMYGQVVGEEDCLYLNVFAPAQAGHDGRLRPVMVWIHGGALAVGTSALYDAARDLARQDDVVVVTINYRLGILGWFTHPDLADADHASPEERSGNFGLLDQIAALRWVRQNIAAFGGDPDCVTIFGESAGGQSVLLLLASPLAAGLFHRAIAQSPVAETFSLDQAVHSPASGLDCRQSTSEEVSARLWTRAGRSTDISTARQVLSGLPAADVATFLRSLSPQELLAVHTPGSVGIYLAPRAARDGHVLPIAPLPQVFASGRWNRVPVILGSNRDEMRTFMADKPEHSRLLGGKLPLLRDRPAYLAESRYQSRAWRALHMDAVADAMLAGGHTDVWTYRFDWDEAPAIPFVRPDLLLGAAHAMEIPFSFHHACDEFDPFNVATPFNRKSREALAAAMGMAWSCFARTGRPSLPDGHWVRRTQDPTDADSLIFDSPTDGGVRMSNARESIHTIRTEIGENTQLPPQVRCAIHARLFLWSPLFEGHGDLEDYARLGNRLACNLPATAFRPRIEM